MFQNKCIKVSCDHPLTPYEEDVYTKGLVNAYMSMLAYHDESQSKEELMKAISKYCFQRRNVSEIIHDDKTDTHALVLQTGSDMITVALEGTDKFEDWWKTNINFLPYMLDFGVFVHRGFAKALNSVYSEIKDSLQKHDSLTGKKTVYITGHSLGCGLASILTYRLASEYPQLRSKMRMYLYGCPVVGNNDFNQKLRGFNVESYSFTLENDPVSLLNVFSYKKPLVWCDHVLPCPSGWSICHEIHGYINELIKKTKEKFNGRCC